MQRYRSSACKQIIDLFQEELEIRTRLDAGKKELGELQDQSANLQEALDKVQAIADDLRAKIDEQKGLITCNFRYWHRLTLRR
jgi:uncharacterized coiled-coil DUF342 family protein